MSSPQNTRLGIWLMIATCAVFAVQDALSRHLGGVYNVWMIVAIRFWFFALFALAVVARAPGGWGRRCGRPIRCGRRCAACCWACRSA